MTKLEEIQQGAHVRGLDSSSIVTVEAVNWIGEQAIKVIYSTTDGKLGDRVLYRDDEPTIELADGVLLPLRRSMDEFCQAKYSLSYHPRTLLGKSILGYGTYRSASRVAVGLLMRTLAHHDTCWSH